MPTQATMKHVPAIMIARTPKRLISPPVKKPGAYMPTTCHSMTNAAAEYGWLQKSMAIGVAVISKFMTPYPSAAPMAATMKAG